MGSFANLSPHFLTAYKIFNNSQYFYGKRLPNYVIKLLLFMVVIPTNVYLNAKTTLDTTQDTIKKFTLGVIE